MQSYPVFGMYQPDAITLIRHNEVDYIVSANEGDSKEYGDDFNEEPRVKDLMLSSNFGKLVFDIFLNVVNDCFYFDNYPTTCMYQLEYIFYNFFTFLRCRSLIIIK